jgi:hypothetical protein
LLECLTSPKSKLELKAQAAWALGNVAGESPSYREELMRKNFPQAIVNVLNDVFDDAYDRAIDSRGLRGASHYYDEEYFSDIEALLWSLSNMSRGGFRVAEYYQYVKYINWIVFNVLI